MIHARLTDAPFYRGIHPRLDRALDLLTPEFLSSIGTQTLLLEGEALYVTRFDYETVPYEETFFESHRRYLDIQLMLKGEELVDIAHPTQLHEFEQHGDFWGYHGDVGQRIRLCPGDFLVVFPGDAHRLKILTGAPAPVTKVVFKVLFRDEQGGHA